MEQKLITESEAAHPADSASGTGAVPAGGASTRARAHGRAHESNAGSEKRVPATYGDDRSGLVARLVTELTPPEPWTHQPASLAAMWRYARRGGWTGPTGPARVAGVWWCRLVTIPVCVVTHYTAWLVARPSRALTAALVALLLWLAVTR